MKDNLGNEATPAEKNHWHPHPGQYPALSGGYMVKVIHEGKEHIFTMNEGYRGINIFSILKVLPTGGYIAYVGENTVRLAIEAGLLDSSTLDKASSQLVKCDAVSSYRKKQDEKNSQLLAYYGVLTTEELIPKMEAHIKRLQRRVNKLDPEVKALPSKQKRAVKKG
jgi:hypothetical protein